MTDVLHRKRIEVRWRDIDGFGHVNNSVFLTYVEECRDEWLASALGDARLVNEFVMARIAVDYRGQLTQADDVVEVSLRLARVGRSSLTTVEEVRVASDGRLAAEAESVIVRLDWETGGSRPLDELAERFQTLIAR